MEFQTSQKLSNLQLELLKLYAMNVSDEELRDIKRMLVKYFMERAMDEADKVWDERGYTNELMEEWRQAKRSELKK
jgi:DNA primase large subunit